MARICNSLYHTTQCLVWFGTHTINTYPRKVHEPEDLDLTGICPLYMHVKTYVYIPSLKVPMQYKGLINCFLYHDYFYHLFKFFFRVLKVTKCRKTADSYQKKVCLLVLSVSLSILLFTFKTFALKTTLSIHSEELTGASINILFDTDVYFSFKYIHLACTYCKQLFPHHKILTLRVCTSLRFASKDYYMFYLDVPCF